MQSLKAPRTMFCNYFELGMSSYYVLIRQELPVIHTYSVLCLGMGGGSAKLRFRSEDPRNWKGVLRIATSSVRKWKNLIGVRKFRNFNTPKAEFWRAGPPQNWASWYAPRIRCAMTTTLFCSFAIIVWNSSRNRRQINAGTLMNLRNFSCLSSALGCKWIMWRTEVRSLFWCHFHENCLERTILRSLCSSLVSWFFSYSWRFLGTFFFLRIRVCSISR